MVLRRTDSSTRRRPPHLLVRVLKVAAKSALVLALLASVILTSDVHRLNVAERAASQHLYSLVQWELSNFMGKWLHRATSILPWNSLSETEREERVADYFALTEARAIVSAAISEAAADSDLPQLQARLAILDEGRERLRPDVEEVLEAVISAVLVEEGLSSFGGLILPPVDFLLTRPPYVLVTSPRDRIERGEEALLRPEITLFESEAVEDSLLAQQNLSALVIPIGGVATYPASIFDEGGLRWTLQIAAHEWLHHYLFFRPLGFNIFSTEDMRVLNETVAELAGREIGDRAFVILGGVIEDGDSDAGKGPGPVDTLARDDGARDDGGFDFQREMRATRLRVDELLAEGTPEGAEVYMERRRLVFVANGYNIRKLNQAYFAFNGTYAESAASVSPIGEQVRRLRDLSPDLGTFIAIAASAGSYDAFLADLRSRSLTGAN